MQASIERLEDKVIVQPTTDLVDVGVSELRTTLREVAGAGIHNLVLDLRQVRMVDSSGIALLVAAHNTMRRLGGGLAVIHASADILQLIRSMRIHQHFSVSGD